MSDPQLIALGALAGFTIFLGLPVGRLRSQDARLMAFLNATATGILLFLLVEVLEHSLEPVEDGLVAAAVEHNGSWFGFVRMATVLILSVAIGLLGLVYYDRYARRRELAASVGAAAAADLPLRGAALSPPRRLALLIAIGIGLHNFAEGLAIGQSAAKGAVSLALLLIVGFGLHNATEGFGIVAPLAREPGPASWGFLVLAGLIGGGPTLIGTIVGRSIVNETLSLAFLGLAAGSILYVVMELLNVGRRMGFAAILGWGLLLGFFLGVATDFVLVAAGL